LVFLAFYLGKPFSLTQGSSFKFDDEVSLPSAPPSFLFLFTDLLENLFFARKFFPFDAQEFFLLYCPQPIFDSLLYVLYTSPAILCSYFFPTPSLGLAFFLFFYTFDSLLYRVQTSFFLDMLISPLCFCPNLLRSSFPYPKFAPCYIELPFFHFVKMISEGGSFPLSLTIIPYLLLLLNRFPAPSPIFA